MIINIHDIPQNICGIYKINYNNGKIYIGQAVNIYKRALEHNSKNKMKCDKALKEFEANIEILEVIKDVTMLEEIELCYIKKYNATNPEIGYNVCEHGNVTTLRGCDHPNAAFSQEEVKNIVDLLANHKELSIKEIASMYGVNTMTITRISQGKSYTNPDLQYPLRENDHTASKKDDIFDYFNSEEMLLLLKRDLLYAWDLSIEEDLPKKYNIPLKIVRAINNGTKFADAGNYSYPIRGKNIRNNLHFTKQNILDILNDLRNSNNSMSSIGEKYKINRCTVSKINKGDIYCIEAYDYPARKT